MDCSKVGNVIAKLRKDKKLKQREVAELMNLSDKTISKWERGLGCPDVSLLKQLSNILGTNIETILDGKISESKTKNDNMKNLKFYFCPKCSNVITSFDDMSVFCCGKKLECKTPIKADDNQKLKVTLCDNEYMIESDCPMTKENYIPFVAYMTVDKLTLVKLYPEWSLSFNIFNYGSGKLIWSDNKGNMFYQLIK